MRLDIRNEADFEKLMESLADDLADANIHFKLYRNLNDSIDEFARELNQSAAFWTAVFIALRDSTLFLLCRIYDQHEKALSLPNWLDTIKANLSLFDIANFRARLKDNPFVDALAESPRKPVSSQLEADIEFASESEPVKKLIKLRMNVLAHKYAKNIMRGIDPLKGSPFTDEEIQSLLDTGLTIFDRYSDLFRAHYYASRIIGDDDYLRVLGAIRADLERREAEFLETMKRISDLETGKQNEVRET